MLFLFYFVWKSIYCFYLQPVKSLDQVWNVVYKVTITEKVDLKR